jgi:dTDP-4-amino-4,6-dideoxygalactose transaminase
MTSNEIPLHRPYLPADAAARVQAGVESGWHGGDGPHATAACRILEEIMGGSNVFLTPSGTHALELAATVLDLQPGDEVIVPSFTFASTANAFAVHGATPVFVDIRSDTWNLDERLVADAITERTRAIVPVHYGGVACEMDVIGRIAAERDIAVIEDTAHGLGGSYRGRPLGTFGSFAALSFHETKNIQCGEGGAIVVNDPEPLTAAEVARDKGTDRAQFFRGEIDKYTWRALGSSHILGELPAALLSAQLDSCKIIQSRRHEIWATYRSELDAWAATAGVEFQSVPEDCRHPAHLFALLMPSAEARARFIAHMRGAGITAAFHYQPLHISPAGRARGRTGPAGCPTTVNVSERVVRLPLYPDMSDAELGRVVRAARAFLVAG